MEDSPVYRLRSTLLRRLQSQSVGAGSGSDLPVGAGSGSDLPVLLLPALCSHLALIATSEIAWPRPGLFRVAFELEL